MTMVERQAFIRCVKEAKADAEMDLELMHAAAAKRASVLWNLASPAVGDHPYLIRKRIMGHCARIFKRSLVLPVVDFDDKLTSLQFIEATGCKRLLAGGRKRGCYIPVAGDPASARRIIVCEGWATGCTLAEDDPDSAVIAAIDAGNLELVAVEARCHWPNAELVVAGDDDRQTAGNPGATKALAAALAAEALLALPQWPVGAPNSLTDFNDLAAWIERSKL